MTGSRRPGLRQAIRDLDPGCFALVMATGIVSQAVRLDGAAWLSGVLLGAGIAAYLLLAVALVWRLACYCRQVRADARDPRRASSHELGIALKVSWLVTLGRDEAWPALAIWAAVFLAMARALPRRLARQGCQAPPG